MENEDRVSSEEIMDETERSLEKTLRPQYFNQYIGQDKIKNELMIYIEAAKNREEALDHVLLYGPPGLGKTTMAMVIANEMNTTIRTTSGPAIEKPGDLVALLNDLEPGGILFIDEIHRLPRVVEEILYSAMEDYFIDIIIGQGETAHPVHFPLPPFTLIGATTRAGNLSAPLRDRFGILSHMEYYTESDLKEIVERTSDVLRTKTDQTGAIEVARRSRGTPRIANRLLKRVRDYAEVIGEGVVTEQIASKALDLLRVDHQGLDIVDQKLLKTMIEIYNGGPVGLNTLSANIGEEMDTIEDMVEPFLLKEGFIQRTPRGRVATAKAYQHFNIPLNENEIN
ncbi:Holliday junction branch migration DNA helicase RuvB [Marinilactibacillus psychrotolerans]|uniref:Holliday junction branch migration complex subunit RuvB n=2 Tax=Marinilactibacillus psychrotolerans TaxID=191770 RepID=A0A511H2T9_9LACT|nr:Holliday junction branch migration DNA helicase RuvB [Marinilactibacillus psychrotolerans]TLQ07379.1 Holliday junction branch migration DNA helicase RuvB [Marinilactibacillus psychrotolerans]SDC02163.1 Holliday junction DNA helicase subunit RuvB [Marinilactibacillus psychrotolerans]SJN30042.1 Holliday junction DNA helicase RuvB [Marinilactibacillus psychrotolerans 42ea]GEL67835.1 Holliday junction ATP-dependent DNA helicase RuvB [Marinilactibacillus psychrotolerans]GEQ33066.1 Holliday junct